MPELKQSAARTEPETGEVVRNESAVRDHLANERTYLAWLRTTVALLGLGFLLARFQLELGMVPARPEAPSPGWLRGPSIGLGFAILGLLTLVFSTWRYLAVRRMIDLQRFVPLRAGVIVISTGAAAVALGVIIYLLLQIGN